jgi:serine protease Do
MNSSLIQHHRLLIVLVIVGSCSFTTSAHAQPRIRGVDRAQINRDDKVTGFKENPRMLAAFHDVVAAPSRSVVRVRCDSHDVALGTIVGADGWIITKNSELTPGFAPIVVLRDGRTLLARVVGVETHYDLAMLKVEVKNLIPIQWGESKSAIVGELLASPGVGTEPVAVGVLSVAARAVRARDLAMPPPPANAGYLGVGLDEGEGGARVAEVKTNSAADKAGLKVNDVVTLIADTPIIDSETMVNTIRHHKPGDALPIKILRDGKELELQATLGKRPPDPGLARREYQNHLGSDLSEHRSGFPQILQHDMVLRPDNCGGPVVDLDGKAIGINIARAGRVESYAIPVEAVRALLDDLKSGKLSPATEPSAQLAGSSTKATSSPNEKNTITKSAPTQTPAK